MRISYKMILLFSIVLVLTVSILTSYSTDLALREFDAGNALRFRNIGLSVLDRLEQQISMMDLATQELLDNTTFMAALGQFVRNATDQKMSLAAMNTVSVLLNRSPLVDKFYRVSIYTREGGFITSSNAQEDSPEDPALVSGTPEARQLISSLPWLSQVDADPERRLILPPHADYTDPERNTMVYGVVRGVVKSLKQIGYIQVSAKWSELNSIVSMLDDPAVHIQVMTNDDTLFFCSDDSPVAYPTDMETMRLLDWEDSSQGVSQKVMRLSRDGLEMSLYVAQNKSILEQQNASIRWRNVRTAALISLPTLAIIIWLSLRLTRSIRLLTQRVNQTPADMALQSVSVDTLSRTVTAPDDREIHELEQVFNDLMLRLRESTQNELASREGTLQAQLSALQTQINPHFIYNTLNIISAKSMESGNLDVIEICDQFAQMLRYSTDTRSRTATMADEIENVRSYLLLAKARYEDNLEFTIDIPEHLSDILVPKLTLQPLVENALTHGYDGQNQKRLLSIQGWIERGQLTVEIRDNGTGFSDDMLSHFRQQFRAIEAGDAAIQAEEGHIGVVNTFLRLHYYSHGTMHMHLRNDHGAVVTLTMPCKQL